jgi:hypothetical protein
MFLQTALCSVTNPRGLSTFQRAVYDRVAFFASQKFARIASINFITIVAVAHNYAVASMHSLTTRCIFERA